MSTAAPPFVEVSRVRLWFGVLGGGVAWLAHLLLGYGIAEFGCVSSLGGQSWLGISAVAWLLLALSALTTMIAVAATFDACRVAGSNASGSNVSLARVGMYSSGLFALTIVVESVPILYYLRSC